MELSNRQTGGFFSSSSRWRGLCGLTGSQCVRFKRQQRALVWNYSTGGVIVVSSPAVWEGKLYIGSNDQNLYCLNTSNGELIWKYTTDGMVVSSPAVSNGVVYFGSYDHKVYAVNALSGDLVWSFRQAAKFPRHLPSATERFMLVQTTAKFTP